jgi:cobyrinic acid a,c-diamide synthase
MAHEFHYAEEVARTADAEPLFRTHDALGKDLGGAGAVDGSAFGSFSHLIDKAD